MRIKKRLIGIILVLSLVAGIVPMPVQTVVAADEDKVIMSGVSGIAGQQADSIYFGTYSQSSAGTPEKYNDDPIKWRVLANEDDKLFLLADQNLDTKPYHTSDVAITWENSSLRSWLNGTDEEDFYATAFDSIEQEIVAAIDLENAGNPTTSIEGGSNTTDKVFLLSYEEASNEDYFADNSARIGTDTVYAASKRATPDEVKVRDWWLRTPGYTSRRAANVNEQGKVEDGGMGVYNKQAVRPAMKLDVTRILFTSAVIGGKAVRGMDSGLTVLESTYEGTEWKATLVDTNRNFSANVTEQTADSVTVSYEGAKTGANEYISAIVVDSTGAYSHYGRIANVTETSQASGSVDINISGIDLTDKTLYVFNEQYNGGPNDDTKLSDYASALVELEFEIEVPVENKLKAISVPGFKHASSSSFYNAEGTQMADVVTIDGGADSTGDKLYATYPTMKDIKGDLVTTLDRTLLSFQLDFEKVAMENYTFMQVAGVGLYKGIRIYPGNGYLRVEAAPNTQTSGAKFNINVDNDAVTSFTETFILQLSFEYGDYDEDENTDKNDLRLGVYINGKFFEADYRAGNGAAKEGQAIFYNCTENLGVYTYTQTYQDANACDLTVSSVVPVNESLTKITWSDFLSSEVASPDKAFVAKADMGYIYGSSLNSSILDSKGQAINKLSNTSFEANLIFTSNGSGNNLRFGANGLWADDMQIYGDSDGHLGSNLMTFNKDIAEVETFYRKEFTMRITTEYGDFDGDGASDDVQYGFYFNGKLYNDQYYYWIDRPNPGNRVNVYFDGNANSSILIRSASFGKDTSYDLADGAYMVDSAVYSDVAKVMLGTESVDYQNGLTTAGDYRIYDKNDKLLGTVVLYEKGNVHADDDVDVRDLVALMRLRSGATMTAHAGNIGAYKTNNFDKATLVNMLLE